VIELSRHVLETLREDGEFVLYRSRGMGDLPAGLVLAPVLEHPTIGSLKRLEHEYSLRPELDAEWAARPLTLVRREGRPMLILEDAGGEPLDRLLGQPMELSRFLRFAVGLAAALGKLHQQGLIHKDIKPANILVDSASGAVWLTGFGIASRLPRERQSAEPPETIAGTLAYMAPEQTGRMNRSIDSRSDLYSLGVTLYEMLTGALPFKASDPMEWVHCHIARQPVPPSEYAKEIPGPLSAIVMKLLAKTAEERYQTAAGVAGDLWRSLTEWEAHCRIDPFPLGAQDASDRLLIPEKLYGREREIHALLAAFDRVAAAATSEFVVMSGYSGVGKSSVFNELYKHLTPRRGLFASCKFDRYRRDVPYATLGQAFQTLINQILADSDAEVSHWRNALREAVGPNGQLVVDLIPELEFVIGKQPPVPELAPQDAQNRFHLVFRRFIGVFAKPEHPLALFLDDLQWLDAATLELLEHFITEREIRHLLLVGAYADNEVSPSHPLLRTFDVIRKVGATIQEIILVPLGLDDVGRLVADSLHCEESSARPLAELVYEKTAGNPFFAIQFLTALAEERLLVFDSGAAAWSWDLTRIRAKGYTDNVVDLMGEKLSRLPHATREALGQLASLGNVAEIATLALVQGASEEQIHAALWEAVRAGLVCRLDGVYTFVHGRVQDAAYALIPESERAAVHLGIGRLFVSRTAPEEMEEKIFETVNQLNRGAVLIDSLEERARLAELNLVAGKRAKAATAYASALTYFVAGRALLSEESWEERYALTFALEFQRAECEFLTGEFTTAEERLSMLSRHAEDLADGAVVARLQTELYAALDQNDRAVAAALQYLRRAGVDWSPHPTNEEVRREYERIWHRLGNRPIEALVDLPPMTDLACRATLDLLTAVEEPSFFIDENLRGLVITRIVNLSLEHGNSDGSCVAFVQLGWLVGPRFDDHKAAFRFGKLGLDLMEKRGLERFRTRVSQCFGYFINPWSRHLRSSLELLRRSFHTAQEAGDIKYAVYSCDRLVTILLAAGDPLGDVRREAETGLEFARKANFGYIVDIIIGQLRFIRALQGLTTSLCSFSDPEFDESRFEQNLKANPHSVFARCWYWLRKLQVCFYAGDYPAALEAASKTEPLLQIGPGHFEWAEYLFYDALARAAQYDSATPEEKVRYREALAVHHKQIVVWAENCPENFGNRAALVAAEIARIEGRELDAESLYEKAIQSAREHGFVQNEAIAHEVAARFYSARGFETIAHAYLRNARYCYLRWGALGKVRQIDQFYSPLYEERSSSSSITTIGTSVEQLDLGTVMKASHAVAGEIVLGKLIKTLMMIALEHAGAERGLLILSHGEELRIAAEARTGRDGVEVELQDGLVTPSDLPDSLLHYVIRTQESVILDDASTQNLFSQDEYVRQRRPRSVLCLPLVKQVNLVGILYLENSLAPHVFTPKRLAMLEMLASQAAISLDHARLYEDLNRLNAELRRSEAYLAEGEKISHTASWAWNVATGEAYWSQEHFRIFGFDPGKAMPSYPMFLQRIHPEDRCRAEQTIDRAVRERSDFVQEYRLVLPDGSIKYVHTVGHPVVNESGVFEFIGTAMDVTDLKRAEEMRAAMAREREQFAQQRATELAKANEALRGCLDALASVRELDDFLGQVMATMTRQLGAVSSTLRVRNFEQNTLPLELVFQDGRVMSPDEAKYPEEWRNVSLGEQRFKLYLNEPSAIARTLDPHSPMPDGHRSYLLRLGVKTILVISLTSRGQVNGRLTFRFTEERDFQAEELEIARALATQASLAIQLTELAKTARHSAVLVERNRLAGEIHDSLAQSFAGISLQLSAAEEDIKTKDSDGLNYIERANDIARFGLGEARRSTLSLLPSIIGQSGLIEALQMLVDRSNIPGRLRCTFQSNSVGDESLPQAVQRELLRIAQEAISNALRHAKPTVISVSLRSSPPNLVLEVRDNGSGIVSERLKTEEGFGFINMRERAKKLNATLDIRTAPGRGTIIIVSLPVN
jgi:PAS domain S-box-containing protein